MKKHILFTTNGRTKTCPDDVDFLYQHSDYLHIREALRPYHGQDIKVSYDLDNLNTYHRTHGVKFIRNWVKENFPNAGPVMSYRKPILLKGVSKAFAEMRTPKYPAAFCPEKVTVNDGWVFIFRDKDVEISPDHMKAVFVQNKYVHRIFDVSDGKLEAPFVTELIKHTGKVYIYNYCNLPDNALAIAELAKSLEELDSREVLYHIGINVEEIFKQQYGLENTVKIPEQWKSEPEQAKIKPLLVLFAPNLSQHDKNIIRRIEDELDNDFFIVKRRSFSERFLTDFPRGISKPMHIYMTGLGSEHEAQVKTTLKRGDIHNLMTFHETWDELRTAVKA